jgi:uncharacterized membrane protein
MENNKKFGIGEAFSFGWKTVIENLWFCVGVVLVGMVAAIISNQISEAIAKSHFFLASFVFTVGIWLLGALVQAIVYKGLLMMVDGHKPTTLKELLPAQNTYKHYLLGSILFAIGSFIGFVLLIIPGIIFSLAYGLYGFIVIEKGTAPLEAFKHSAEITRGHRGQLFLFGLACLGVCLLGALALGIGLLVATPVTLLATGFVYKKLSA